MKKAISISLIIIFMLSAVSCSEKPSSTIVPNAGTSTVVPFVTPSVTSSATPRPTNTPAPEVLYFTDYVPIKQITASAIPAKTIALAAKMPAASNHALPKWYGMTLSNMAWMDNLNNSQYMTYQEQDIKNFASLGINFLRVPLNFSVIFKEESMDSVNSTALENMDHLLTWALENGIHICFDLHNTPGYSTDGDDSNDTLFQDPDQQQTFIKFWTFMASRYASIPINALSFDLLNEPHGDLDDATYSALMLKAINAIRAVTSDRIIFADMLNIGRNPVQGLVASGVAQSIHAYLPGIGSISSDSRIFPKQNWPIYLINGNVNNNAPLTFNGNFKSGTKVILRLDGFHKNGKIIVRADDTEIGEYEFGNEHWGENYCTQINNQGTDNEYRSYDGAGFKFTLSKDAKKLTFSDTGESVWFHVSGISIENGDNDTFIYAKGDTVIDSNSQVVLNFADDGSVTASNPHTMIAVDDSYYDQSIKEYSDFSSKTGIQVMVQEFGFDPSVNSPLAVKSTEKQISAFQKYGIGWCFWADGFGFLATSESQKRTGATYKQISTNRWVATEMYNMLKKYMQ